jgi:hypothetical protein
MSKEPKQQHQSIDSRDTKPKPNAYFWTRLFFTVLVLIVLKKHNVQSHLVLFVTIFVLDGLDCGYGRDCSNFAYQSMDKVMDWITYFLILVIFGSTFDTLTRSILYALLVWRFIGVVQFTKTKDVRYLHVFFDGMNATILVSYLATKLPWVSVHYIPTIALGLIIKTVFERRHHSSPYE